MTTQYWSDQGNFDCGGAGAEFQGDAANPDVPRELNTPVFFFYFSPLMGKSPQYFQNPARCARLRNYVLLRPDLAFSMF